MATVVDDDLLSRVPPSLTVLVVALIGAAGVGFVVHLDWRLGAALIAAVLGGIAVVRSPRLAAVCLGLVPSLSGLRRGFPVPGLKLSELLGVGVAAVLICSVPKWRVRSWDALDWVALVWVASNIVLGGWDVAVAHHARLDTDTVSTLVAPLQFLLIFRGLRIALGWVPVRRTVLLVILLASVPMAVAAVLQRLNVPGVRSALVSLTGTDPFLTPGYTAVARASGLFTIWHLLAGYELAVLFLAVTLLLTPESDVLGSWGLCMVIGWAVVGLILSLTATCILGAIVGVVLIGWRAGRLKLILRWALPVGVVACLAFFPLINARIQEQTVRSAGSARSSIVPQTLSYRARIWQEQYFPVIVHNVGTGWGPTLPSSITWKYSESVYLTLLLRGGLPLLTVYGALCWTMASRCRRLRGDPDVDAAAITTWALVVVLVPMQVLFPYFVTAGLPHLLWVFAAIAVSPITPEDRVRARATGPESGAVGLLEPVAVG